MNAQNILSEYLGNVLYNPQKAVLDFSKIQESDKEFAIKLQQFCDAVLEVKSFSDSLSDGDINREISGENPLAGSLKELQAGLRHFEWQARQVTNGDYSQKADFLGEFSDVFNEMKKHLVERETLAKKNHELEVQLTLQQQAAFKQQLEQQESYYHYIMDMHNKLRAFRHDMQNHFLCFDSLLVAGNVEEARKYITSVFSILESKAPTISTDNYMFDILLAEKMRRAQDDGIAVEYSLNIKPKLKIENFDWCIMLGNAMDNAIEACAKIENKENRKIFIKAATHKAMLNIVIKNTSVAPVAIDKNTYATTKHDKKNHGLGLKNISKTVESYGGVMKTGYENGYFTIAFLLCDV
ncbi:MAG: GHKL domain-containing protein [Oscillospiraceae bacterium]